MHNLNEKEKEKRMKQKFKIIDIGNENIKKNFFFSCYES